MSAPLPRESGPMLPGRELDALIAERVFGQVEAHAPCGDGLTRTCVVYGATFAECDGLIREAYPRQIAEGMRIWPAEYCGPHFSTSIADAWLVVGAMLKRGFALTLMHEDFEKPWMAEFADTASAKTFAREALTVEHAICLSALAVPPTPGGREP